MILLNIINITFYITIKYKCHMYTSKWVHFIIKTFKYNFLLIN